ncbi:transcriptional regulator [Brachybacterium phenoliresistens]|uniref:Transcriptional regulator n=1 Tax=Brachybacterium phenoliresistens TaxID=396014 RepID=Z9JW49_9MICO|nr:ROK family transcriptional regulator [Brachybacterium phenoliresistens]EWS82243.1 transcriptional regulator [Brachybacterium phenoliresistens]
MAVSDPTHAAVRHATTRDCFLALREADGPLTVAEIAAGTGLSRPTVDSVLRDLAATGLVVTAPPGAGGQPGRPARRIALDPGSASVAALDIGSRTVRCVRADASGAILSRSAVPVAGGGIADAVLAAVRETGGAPRSLGVSVPGIIGPDGRIAHSLVVPELSGHDLAGTLHDRLGCEVVVENDIKLAAYAERHLGASAQDIVFVQIGHRISVAVIVGGEILQGSHRLAGELGAQRGMRWTPSSQRGRLVWSTGDEARPLLERAAAGDAAARAELEEFCAQIAPRLAGLLLAVDPEVVVIGGGVSRAGETLLAPLRRALHHQLMTPQHPEVVAARRPGDGSLLGALGRAFEHGSAALIGVPGVPPPWHRLNPALREDHP